MADTEPAGISYLRRLGLYNPTSGMLANLGLRIIQAEPGLAVVEADVNDDAHGFPTSRGSIIHGGAVATIADCALACAGATVMNEGEAATTADLRVEFFRVAVAGRIQARAEVRHRSRRLVFCQASVSQEGKVVAEARATIALVPA